MPLYKMEYLCPDYEKDPSEWETIKEEKFFDNDLYVEDYLYMKSDKHRYSFKKISD